MHFLVTDSLRPAASKFVSSMVSTDGSKFKTGSDARLKLVLSF